MRDASRRGKPVDTAMDRRWVQGDGRRFSTTFIWPVSWKAAVSLSLTIAAPVVRALESVRPLAQDETRELLRLASPEERAEWLVTLQQLTDAAAAATLVATEVFDARGDAQTLQGAASTQGMDSVHLPHVGH
jgi:hypothetical protein